MCPGTDVSSQIESIERDLRCFPNKLTGLPIHPGWRCTLRETGVLYMIISLAIVRVKRLVLAIAGATARCAPNSEKGKSEASPTEPENRGYSNRVGPLMSCEVATVSITLSPTTAGEANTQKTSYARSPAPNTLINLRQGVDPKLDISKFDRLLK